VVGVQKRFFGQMVLRENPSITFKLTGGWTEIYIQHVGFHKPERR